MAGKAAKGLPMRTGKASMKAKTARHFSRAEAKKYNRVLRNANGDKAKADAWKLARIHKALRPTA